HCLLLQALGLELGRLDPGAKDLRRRGRDELRRRLQGAPHGAQRNDGGVAPGADAALELGDLGGRQRAGKRCLPEQEQQQVDVDAGLLLQGDAGLGDLGPAVDAQREPPERRAWRGRRLGRAHVVPTCSRRTLAMRSLSGVLASARATLSTCAMSAALSGTPYRSRSARRAARPWPGTRISSAPGRRRDEENSRTWRSTSALNRSGGRKRATSSAITNWPTLSSPPGGAAKSRMSRPNAAPLSGPAKSPMMIESPLPL